MVVCLQTCNRSDANQSRGSVQDVLTNNTTYVPHGDRVDSQRELVGRQSTPVAEHLSANVLTDRRRAIQHQQHVCQQQVLGSGDFILTQGRTGEPLPLGEHRVDCRVDRGAIGYQIDAPQASVSVTRVE